MPEPFTPEDQQQLQALQERQRLAEWQRLETERVARAEANAPLLEVFERHDLTNLAASLEAVAPALSYELRQKVELIVSIAGNNIRQIDMRLQADANPLPRPGSTEPAATPPATT